MRSMRESGKDTAAYSDNDAEALYACVMMDRQAQIGQVHAAGAGNHSTSLTTMLLKDKAVRRRAAHNPCEERSEILPTIQSQHGMTMLCSVRQLAGVHRLLPEREQCLSWE